MNIKEKLLKFKNKNTFVDNEEKTNDADSLANSLQILNSSIDKLKQRNQELEEEVSELKNKKVDKSSTDLDDKINAFIEWYYNNMVKGHFTEISEYQKPKDMRNFIEKMAVWYELRYPDYEINRLMNGSFQESNETNSIMFMDNHKDLDWNDFYNSHAFISSLSREEREYFTEPKYYNLKNGEARLKLTSTGIIQNAEMLNSLYLWLNEEERETIDTEFKGKHIEELVKFLKSRAAYTSVYKSLEEIVTNYNNQLYQREEMLNCVMYRIIERGGNRVGPRRAFLFAKEFERNIDIPMMYAADLSDPGLKLFINEYISAGGSKDLKCYLGYFDRVSKDEKLDTISVQDLILRQNSNVTRFYTPKEDELHQRLVNLVASQANQEILKEDKKLILERKL